jgi:hypothetical protein
MFERNKIDTGNDRANQAAVPAEVVMADGEVLIGHFVFASSRSFGEVLNSDAPFIEFEPHDGARRYLAKGAIRSIALRTVPTARLADVRRPLAGEFDPYATLGVPRDASPEDVRHAYLRLTKAYHADRFASVELPDEVRRYLADMSARINAAYALVEAPVVAVKKATMRAEPVYSSPSRA